MAPSRLYHNAHCTKSRNALALLQARGLAPEVVHYLDNPPSPLELRELLGMLALPARALLRTGESEFEALGLADPSLTDDFLIAAMAAHPRLIERPIFVHGERAVIGRPPEKVLDIL